MSRLISRRTSASSVVPGGTSGPTWPSPPPAAPRPVALVAVRPSAASGPSWPRPGPSSPPSRALKCFMPAGPPPFLHRQVRSTRTPPSAPAGTPSGAAPGADRFELGRRPGASSTRPPRRRRSRRRPRTQSGVLFLVMLSGLLSLFAGAIGKAVPKLQLGLARPYGLATASLFKQTRGRACPARILVSHCPRVHLPRNSGRCSRLASVKASSRNSLG